MASFLKSLFAHARLDHSSIDDTSTLIRRVVTYRRSGSSTDGLHVLSEPLHITALDYALMGADNSCARIVSGGLSGDVTLESRWFAVAKDSGLDPRGFYNSHSSSDDGGKTWYLESLLTEIPKPQFQVSPEEVVWHHLRVTALRAQGIERDERVRIMEADRRESRDSRNH